MNRAEVVERLRAGAELVFNLDTLEFSVSGLPVSSAMGNSLINREPMITKLGIRGFLYYHWVGDVPGHSPAKSE